ncbi:hypothetical protein MD484_g6838, partial [Candolleomyces efflorescens]
MRFSALAAAITALAVSLECAQAIPIAGVRDTPSDKGVIRSSDNMSSYRPLIARQYDYVPLVPRQARKRPAPRGAPKPKAKVGNRKAVEELETTNPEEPVHEAEVTLIRQTGPFREHSECWYWRYEPG